VKTLRRTLATVVTGDRPFRAAIVAIIVLAVLMLAGPFGKYLDGRDRVELLEQQRDVLHAEIDRLEQRAEDLNDLDLIELTARERFGLVRPGEVPYVVVVPEYDDPKVPSRQEPTATQRPWYRRLMEAVTGFVR
jgi:cell division protein FtsB